MTDSDFDKMMEIGFGVASFSRAEPGTIPSMVNLTDVTAGIAEKLNHDCTHEPPHGSATPILALKVEDLSGEEHTMVLLITDADALGRMVRAVFSMVLTEEDTTTIFEMMNHMVQEMVDERVLPELMEENRETLFGDRNPFEEM